MLSCIQNHCIRCSILLLSSCDFILEPYRVSYIHSSHLTFVTIVFNKTAFYLKYYLKSYYHEKCSCSEYWNKIFYWLSNLHNLSTVVECGLYCGVPVLEELHHSGLVREIVLYCALYHFDVVIASVEKMCNLYIWK